MTDEARRQAEEVADEMLCMGSPLRENMATKLLVYRADAVAQAVKESWAPTCAKTGKKAINGVCPEHGGDGCLMASEIARLNGDIMRHESDRAVVEKEIARLRATLQVWLDQPHIVGDEQIREALRRDGV